MDAIQETNLISVINPITSGQIGTVENYSAEQVGAAVRRAREAQPAWAKRGDLGRARFMQLWANALWQQRDSLVETIRKETGKNETGALLEIIVLDNTLSYYAHHTPRLLKPHRRRTLFPVLQYANVYYRPYGVVGFITPWNYPYLNALLDVVPALVAGNTVVIKPSEVTPFSALRAVEIAYQVGLPRDAIQVITGDGQTGAALVDHVDLVSVTGSTTTGRKVATRAAERLIPYTLELGGKDPLIVLDDVNLDIAATTVLQGALENAGQVCVSVERVYVLDRIYDRFIDKLVSYAGQMRLGGDTGLDVHMGSMTNDREMLRVEAHIQDAIAKGARVVLGGHRREDLGPRFFAPTILADVDHTMTIMREETFGPVIPVMRVHSADEAVRLANDSPYGLSASILTQNLKRGESLAGLIDSGDVNINRTQFVIGTPSVPSGGRKQSGIGRRNGPEGLLRFVTTQTILVDRGWISRPGLTLLDPTLYRVLRLWRAVTHYLPFLRL